MAKTQKVEVARSFSRKVNTGDYENIDVFCSTKAEVDYDDMEEASVALYDFCQKEVDKSVELHRMKKFEHDGSKELEKRLEPKEDKTEWQKNYNKTSELETLEKESQESLL